MTKITVDDWEQALAELKPECADQGFSTAELAERWNVSHKGAVERLRTIMESGRLVVGRRRMLRIDGRLTTIPVYSLKAKDKRKSK